MRSLYSYTDDADDDACEDDDDVDGERRALSVDELCLVLDSLADAEAHQVRAMCARVSITLARASQQSCFKPVEDMIEWLKTMFDPQVHLDLCVCLFSACFCSVRATFGSLVRGCFVLIGRTTRRVA
jgi:hypothetical protein